MFVPPVPKDEERSQQGPQHLRLAAWRQDQAPQAGVFPEVLVPGQGDLHMGMGQNPGT